MTVNFLVNAPKGWLCHEGGATEAIPANNVIASPAGR